MATKNSIKVIKTTTTVEVNDTDHLLTIEPEKSVTLELANTEGYTDEELNEIKWIANMFHGRPQNSIFHKTLKGPKAKFKIPTVYCGGGLGWVEPVLPGNEPTFRPPNGYFINSIGKRGIAKIEWCDTAGKPIQGSKFFSETVQLHIYPR